MSDEGGVVLPINAVERRQKLKKNALDARSERERKADEASALRLAEQWAHKLDEARDEYAAALLRCDDLGIAASAIARQTGRTESAVRMFLKRKREN